MLPVKLVPGVQSCLPDEPADSKEPAAESVICYQEYMLAVH